VMDGGGERNDGIWAVGQCLPPTSLCTIG